MTVIQAVLVPTSEELLRAQEEGGIEFAHGQIVEKPVSIESSAIEAVIIILLGSEALRSRTANVYPSSIGYKCFPEEPDRFRKPDVSVVKTDRIKGFDPKGGLMPIHPDLAVEVISPNDLSYDVAEKVQEYRRAGFPLIWVVQPNTRTVTIHRADGSVTLLEENDEITGETALPGFRCKVAEFFATVG